jgi:hypothetical protein
MKKILLARWSATALAALLGATLPFGSSAQAGPSVSSPSLSLAPSVVILHMKFGQSTTQTITLNNGTSQDLDFGMSAEDVVVKNGKRVFVPAGELPHSIASTAVFSLRSGRVDAQSEKTVQVILTVPAETAIRAVAVEFRSKHYIPSHSLVSLNASLGSLVTFVLTSDSAIAAKPARVEPATASTNLKVVETLTNTGSEPVVATGVAAFVSASGELAAKVPFQSQRLLPGERLDYVAEYPGRLRPGSYRVLCSFSYDGKTMTGTSEFKQR